MSVIDRFAKEEAEIQRLQNELEEEEQRIEARKAAGEPMRSNHYMDLARQIRSRRRELRRAKAYYREAKRRAEIEKIIRMEE